MAGIQAEKKKHSPTGFDLYQGAFNGSVLGGEAAKGERFQGWSRYNGVHLNEPRISSSFSREDTFTYGDTVSFQDVSGKDAEKTPSSMSAGYSGSNGSTRTGLVRNSTYASSSPEYVTSDLKSDRPMRSSGSGVPPLAGGSPSGGRSSGNNNVNSNTHRDDNPASTSPGPALHGRSSSTDDSFRKENHSTHRRQMSDLGSGSGDDALCNGDPRRNVSGEISSSGSSTGGSTPRIGSDSSPYWSRSDSGRFSSKNGSSGSTSSSSGGSPSVLSLKVGSSPVVDSPSPRASTSSSGGSSRGSSLAGSPTVGRTSSVGNLFGTTTTTATTAGSNMTGGVGGGGASTGDTASTISAQSRSSSCNLARGGSTNGGSLSTTGGNPKPAAPSKPTHAGGFPTSIGIICGPNHSRPSTGGTAADNGAKSNGVTPKASSAAPLKPEGLRASADAGRGNIYAVGESLLIKRMLSSTDPEEVKNAGNDQYKKGNFAEALSLYDRAISLAPGRASYKSNRAAALIGLGRLAEAFHECEESLKLDPFYGRAQQRLVSLCIRLGRVERARKLLKSSEHIDPGDIQKVDRIEKHLAKCMEARRASEWNTVVKESEAAVLAGADSASQILALKAEALLKLCRPEEADTVLQAALKGDGTTKKSAGTHHDTTTLCVQVQIDIALGRFDDAVIVAEKAAHFDPQNYEICGLLRRAQAVATARATGNDLYKAGRVLEASVAYGEGLQYNPTNAVLLCNRAACRSKLGLYEKAIEDCNAALDAQPNHLKALLRRAHSYFKLERWKDALRDYERLKLELPGDAEVARSLFDTQVAMKKHYGEKSIPKWFGGEIEEVTSNDQLREALSHPGVAVVLFSSRWNERCRQVAPVVEQLCKKNPTVNFLKVDIEANAYLAKAESVDFVPTFKIFKNGFKVKELQGPNHEALELAVSHFSL